MTTLLLALCLPPPAVAQDVDLRSYRLGSIASWSEAVSVGIKDLALSSPISPADMDDLIDEAEAIADRYGVSVFRETDLLVTDLFPADVASGKHVLLLYRPPTLGRYLALKQRKAELVRANRYSGESREGIARAFGHLLSYPDPVVDEKLLVNGAKLMKRPALTGVWKSPGISLDDETWLIPDLACRNGCSRVSYEYLNDLLADPANDDTSVFDLYNDTLEFNRRYVSNLIRPKTLQSLAGYDAANDAALDCTADGDGLAHQLTAPPAIEFEQLSDRVIIRYEYWNAIRTVYLDRTDAPSEVEPTRLGYSIGHFDDGALVVETTNLIPSQMSLIGNKFYLSDDARFREHYVLSDDGTRLDIAWTVIDPVNLRGPYTGVMAWLRAPDWELDEWRCEAITGEF